MKNLKILTGVILISLNFSAQHVLAQPPTPSEEAKQEQTEIADKTRRNFCNDERIDPIERMQAWKSNDSSAACDRLIEKANHTQVVSVLDAEADAATSAQDADGSAQNAALSAHAAAIQAANATRIRQ